MNGPTIQELILLKDIQALDTQILKIKVQIESAPARSAETNEDFRQAKHEYDKKQAELTSAIKQKKDLEFTAESISDRVKKLKARINDLKTNKEYQSHLKEIDQAEKEKHGVEDDILAVMEKIEKIERNIVGSANKFKTEEARILKQQQEIRSVVEEAQKNLDVLLKQRDQIARSLSRETYDRYMILIERKRGVAVARVVDEVCQGCFMNIPPQLCVEVMKADRVLTCPQCGRILFSDSTMDAVTAGEGS